MNEAAKDAIALLKADHTAVTGLFAEYANTRSLADKKALVAEICVALSVHAQIEQEIFYPAIAAVLQGDRQAPEASDAHSEWKRQIEQLDVAEPDGKLFDAKVKVLFQFVKNHVRRERSLVFPRAKAAAVDMAELVARMSARRAKLFAGRA